MGHFGCTCGILENCGVGGGGHGTFLGHRGMLECWRRVGWMMIGLEHGTFWWHIWPIAFWRNLVLGDGHTRYFGDTFGHVGEIVCWTRYTPGTHGAFWTRILPFGEMWCWRRGTCDILEAHCAFREIWCWRLGHMGHFGGACMGNTFREMRCLKLRHMGHFDGAFRGSLLEYHFGGRSFLRDATNTLTICHMP